MNNGMINPRVDIAFKKLFGVEENKDMLISLLNSIVSEEDQIDEVELLNPYNERNFIGDKQSVLDIKARNKHNGTYFLIEMQIANERDYAKRGLYGWARVYSSQLSEGVQYKDLKRTIAIHILNFTFIDYNKEGEWTDPKPNKYHHRFVLCDKETKIEIFKDIEIHTIELSKFEADTQELSHVLPRIKDMLDRWVTVLTKHELLNVENLPQEINRPEIKKALGVITEMNMSPKERDWYNSHMDYLRREASILLKEFSDGEAKGKAEGEAIGIIKGEAKGIAKGKAEGKLEIAKKMLSKGIDTNTVMEVTELSAVELEKIKNN